MGVECWHKTTLLAADRSHVLASGLGKIECHAAPLRSLSQLSDQLTDALLVVVKLQRKGRVENDSRLETANTSMSPLLPTLSISERSSVFKIKLL